MIDLPKATLKDIRKSLSANGDLFTKQLAPEMELLQIAAPVLLANQISAHYPELLQKQEITVLIAGAAFNETLNGGQSYKILNTLLGIDGIKWKLIFVGNESKSLSQSLGYTLNPTLAEKTELITVLDECFLKEAIEKYGIPELICLNHPGMESHYETWLDEDDTILELLKQGQRIVGASYSTDEVDTDRYHLSAYGINLVGDGINQGYFNAHSTKMEDRPEFEGFFNDAANRAVDQGLADWGQTQWKLELGTGVRDLEKIEVIDVLGILHKTISDYLIDKGTIQYPFEVFDHINRLEGGNRIVRIVSNFSVNLGTWEIFDEESGSVIIEDIEIEVDDFNIKASDLFSTSMIMANVFINYIRDEIPNLKG
ncbi:hypothetical protein OH460_07940 [Vibrio sp. Makdt]|uniref:hypothetical protein n=1 Tax=Vibrio sp. Makdt TaxID=2998828 RepID=UPI0022CD43D5|nr:hypothetical protein [Vibrio sp. Makdt]MDA0152228.1 hypothetical protein [Vibrio sp. Makdt]